MRGSSASTSSRTTSVVCRHMAIGPETALITDRLAVVTGAAVGIGRAIAETFARFGARIAVCDRDADNLASLDAAHTAVFDVRDPDAVAAFVGDVGPIDILVNNA